MDDGQWHCLAGGGSGTAHVDEVIGSYTTLYATDGHLLAAVLTDISGVGGLTATATFADARETYGTFSFSPPANYTVTTPGEPPFTLVAEAIISVEKNTDNWWSGFVKVQYRRE